MMLLPEHFPAARIFDDDPFQDGSDSVATAVATIAGSIDVARLIDRQCNRIPSTTAKPVSPALHSH